MTTLYRPVLIETAEQAEALPVGTVAVDARETTTYVAVKHAPMAWWHARARFLRGSTTVLGFEALVLVEAEEEWTAMGSDDGEPWIAHVGHDGIDGSRNEAELYADRLGGFLARRNLTPWEEA